MRKWCRAEREHVPSGSRYTSSTMQAPPTSLRRRLSYLVAPTLLLSCAGLTIGLAYAPCYSSYCVEYFFPYHTRIHIALFYSLLAVIGLSLTARTWSLPIQRLSQWHFSEKHVPLAGKPLSVGAFVLGFLIVGATFGSTGYWYEAQQQFWFDRGATVDWTEHMFRLAWCGITGHWCDIWAGLVVIPVGRNSILGRTFNIHTSTLLLVHKLLAYGLFAFAIIRGLFFFVTYRPELWAESKANRVNSRGSMYTSKLPMKYKAISKPTTQPTPGKRRKRWATTTLSLSPSL